MVTRRDLRKPLGYLHDMPLLLLGSIGSYYITSRQWAAVCPKVSKAFGLWMSLKASNVGVIRRHLSNHGLPPLSWTHRRFPGTLAGFGDTPRIS